MGCGGQIMIPRSFMVEAFQIVNEAGDCVSLMRYRSDLEDWVALLGLSNEWRCPRYNHTW